MLYRWATQRVPGLRCCPKSVKVRAVPCQRIAKGIVPFMFLDCVTIQVESGAGGNGMIAWRKEKYVAFGGPAGGDGGKGGNVTIRASKSLQTLIDFQQRSHFKAENGHKGSAKNMHGRQGHNLVIEVPLGTTLYDDEDGRLLADLIEDGQEVLVAQGGRGGRGNARFASSRNKAPHFAEPGEPAIVRHLRLELKSIADVGLIGMPNAGKSTLISVISSARPKIANYPFTTLHPNLGVVRRSDNKDGYVVADIPGLIEGASQGVGLGHDFLRHVERTRLLLHLVDATAADGGTPLENFTTIETELAQYSETLANKPRLIVLTKWDSVEEAEQEALLAAFQVLNKGSVFAISSVARQGLDALLHQVEVELERLPRIASLLPAPVEDAKASSNDDSSFEVYAEEGVFLVRGGKVERWLEQTNLREAQSLKRYWIILKSMGVIQALEKKGAKLGDTVFIGDMAFDFYPEGETYWNESRRKKKAVSKAQQEAEAWENTEEVQELELSGFFEELPPDSEEDDAAG